LSVICTSRSIYLTWTVPLRSPSALVRLVVGRSPAERLRRPPLAPWLRINRVVRVILHTRWSAEAWAQVRVEFKRALASARLPASHPPPRHPMRLIGLAVAFALSLL